jgi:hypothetical protein
MEYDDGHAEVRRAITTVWWCFRFRSERGKEEGKEGNKEGSTRKPFRL